MTKRIRFLYARTQDEGTAAGTEQGPFDALLPIWTRDS